MKAYMIIRNTESTNFEGNAKYFSTFNKAANYIFNNNGKFFFRDTDIEEYAETLHNKVHENNWETVRFEFAKSELSELFGFDNMKEYFHITEITID